ncbi:PTS sugar transporter subunit IIA [Lentisphaerota bacterium ZTH]|nr:PTS sugar transporter subunit IIA [Lentisphaerota bacterium]WET06121.1 PTS sugar transporter subunit IIA [Lentisphaerota bacterium ZTH]
MRLVSILNEDLIFCDLAGSTREELYRSMLEKAAVKIDFPENIDTLQANLIEREDLTMIPYEGMAIPHLRNAKLKDLHVIIGLLKTPVKLKKNDLAPTQVIIMSLISDKTSDIYLKSLAAFTRFCAIPGNIQTLAGAATPEDVMQTLGDTAIKKDITAEDVMKADYPHVKADDCLSAVLDVMHTQSKNVLPVLDTENRIIGQLDATDVLRSFVPDYLMMMDNLKFVSTFEMFDKIFQEEKARYVRDYMTPPTAVITPETPLIQFTVTIAKREAATIFVADKDSKLLGAISINSIIHKILRG